MKALGSKYIILLVALLVGIVINESNSMSELDRTNERFSFLKSQDELSFDTVMNDSSLEWRPINRYTYSSIVFKQTNVWVKSRFENDSSQKKEIIFGIDYPFIQLKQLAIKELGSGEISYPHSKRVIRGVPYYSVELEPQSSYDLYLKVMAPQSLLTLNVVLGIPIEFTEIRTQSDMRVLFFISFILGIILYNLALIRFSEDKAYLYYAGYQLSLLIVTSLYHGIAYSFVPIDSLEYRVKLIWFFAFVPLAFGIKYITEITVTRKNFPGTYKAAVIVFWFIILMTVCGIFVPASIQALCFYISGVATIALGLKVFFTIENIGKLSTFVVGWSGLFLLVGRSILGGLGVLPTGFDNSLFLLYGLTWESIFVSFSLGSRLKVHLEMKQVINEVAKGLAPATDLQKYMSSPLERSLNINHQSVTIMFIDIVGYSLTSKLLGDKLTFKLLRSRMQKIEKIIESNNGRVNKNLGDGLICFFGYLSDRNHAQDALNAAREIQHLSFSPETTEGKSVVLPTRIGVNSDDVIVGNVGTKNRADYTLIGDAVNLTSRLEQACNPFRIILSSSTLKQSELNSFDECINEILISIKHHDEPTVAFEYDNNMLQQRKEAELTYFHQLGIQIKHERYAVVDELTLHTAQGMIKVNDVSFKGMSGSADFYLGNNHRFTGKLVSADSTVNEALEETCLNELKLTVRWSKRKGDLFVHGFEISFLNDHQSERFLSILAPCLESRSSSVS